jgi:NADH-quinone oxidoreductase subunit L
MTVSVIAALSAIYFARLCYLQKTDLPRSLSARFSAAYNLLLNKYHVDEIYESAVIRPIVAVSERALWKITDVKLIDGLVNGIARLMGWLAEIFRKMQTGIAQTYAVIMITAIALALFWILNIINRL